MPYEVCLENIFVGETEKVSVVHRNSFDCRVLVVEAETNVLVVRMESVVWR